MADEKRAAEAEIWTRNGWEPGEPVARVEVQARGLFLEEICGRCAVKVRAYDAPCHETGPGDYDAALEEAEEAMCRLFETAIDGIWQYAVREWLRHIVPQARTRRCRCPVSVWWAEVQAVAFVRAGELPLRRRRKRSAVRSAQALGSVLSLVTLHGHHSPWVDTRAPVWTAPDAVRIAHHSEALGIAKARLTDEIARAFEAAAEIVTADLLAHAGTARAALERVIVRWSAASARFQPGAQERFAVDHENMLLPVARSA